MSSVRVNLCGNLKAFQAVYVLSLNLTLTINIPPTSLHQKLLYKTGLKHRKISKSYLKTTTLTMHINFIFILYISMNKSSIMQCIKIFSQQQYEEDKECGKKKHMTDDLYQSCDSFFNSLTFFIHSQ